VLVTRAQRRDAILDVDTIPTVVRLGRARSTKEEEAMAAHEDQDVAVLDKRRARRRTRAPATLVVALLTAAWSFGYALYRGYYAMGGTYGLPGRVLEAQQFRFINAAAAAALLAAAVFPLVTIRLWDRPAARRILVVACWIAAVGCVMHAIIDITEQSLGLAGVVTVPTDNALLRIDAAAAAIQDIVFNEPWFAIEGVLFALLALIHLNRRHRIVWLVSAGVGVLALVSLGMLTVVGVFPRMIIG
jgi:hypothetical protein